MWSILPKALIVVMVSSLATAFSFSAGTPTQCDNLNITWTGGQAPFQLLLSPDFGTPRNISLPSSAFNNGNGSYSTQLTFPQGKKFLITMSDATGFGSGGTSQVLVVGASVSGASCNTTDPGVDFDYSTNDALQQCQPYAFSLYPGAIQPITIFALIPGGQTTILNPLNGPTYEWGTDVAAGTSIMFLMIDSQGRQGGTTDVLTVQSSSDSTCLNGSSPSSTTTPSASSTSTTSPSPTSNSGASSIGAIAGTILGGLIALAVMVTLGLFFLRKWRDDRDRVLPFTNGGISSARRRSQRLGSTDALDQYGRPFGTDQASNGYQFPASTYPAAYPSPNSANTLQRTPPYTPHVFMPPSEEYDPRPFTLPATSHHHTRTHSKATEADSPFADPDISLAGRHQKALAGEPSYKPSRFILHTDVEEAGPPVEEEVVELPPQYTDRRQPTSDVQRQPSSNSSRRQPSTARRNQSGNVPMQDIPVPPIPPTSPRSPPPPVTPPPDVSTWF